MRRPTSTCRPPGWSRSASRPSRRGPRASRRGPAGPGHGRVRRRRRQRLPRADDAAMAAALARLATDDGLRARMRAHNLDHAPAQDWPGWPSSPRRSTARGRRDGSRVSGTALWVVGVEAGVERVRDAGPRRRPGAGPGRAGYRRAAPTPFRARRTRIRSAWWSRSCPRPARRPPAAGGPGGAGPGMVGGRASGRSSRSGSRSTPWCAATAGCCSPRSPSSPARPGPGASPAAAWTRVSCPRPPCTGRCGRSRASASRSGVAG